MQESSTEAEYIVNLCLRTFPHRQEQYVTAVEFMGAWQHEMTSFTLGWRDGDDWLSESLIMRRFKSKLSWWQVDDNKKARREATLMRWLYESGILVPRVHVQEHGPVGNVIIEERLPGYAWFDFDRNFARAIGPYLDEYARLLAKVHSLEVPYTVRQVVPHVTIKSVLQTLHRWARHGSTKSSRASCTATITLPTS
jgi:hypothetical protein